MPGPSRFKFALLGLAVVAMGATLTHWPYVRASACLDSDAAVVVLMGRHFAHGDLSVFFWGQRYMGGLESWALVPFSWFTEPTHLVGSCIVALGLTAIQAICVARIAARLGGEVFVAVLLVTATCAITAFAQTTLYGARLAATTLALVALDIIQVAPTKRRAILSGLLLGVALYGDRLMMVWGLPIALASFRARTLKPFLAAVVPWLLFERVCFALATGPKPGVADPWEWPRNIKLLVLDGLPLMLGADWAAAKYAKFAAPPASGPWLAFSVATMGLAAWVVVWLSRRYRTREVADLLLVPAATAGIFLLGASDVHSTRYLVPAWPAFAVLAGMAAASRPVIGSLAAVVVAANMALSVAHDTIHPHGAASGLACGAELQAAAMALGDAGVQGVWADYWDAYRLGLFMNERMPFAPFQGVDRRPAWTERVRDARPVGYLIADGAAANPLREALDPVATPRRVGRYELYVLAESLPDK